MAANETGERARRGGLPGKRGAVLDAAEELFLAGGFDGTSMDAVAAHAGVSKTTVYAHFHDKVELFHAVAERGGASVDLNLDEVVHVASDDAEEQLTKIAFRVLEATTTPRFLAFLRVMITEAVRRPELTEVIRSLGASHGVDLVDEILRDDAERHGYRLPDSWAYAGMFVRMTMTALQVEALLGVAGERDAAVLQTQARWTASIFLRALRNQDAGSLPDAPANARVLRTEMPRETA